MSVLIKTMTNLPKHCYDCPCHNKESGYCQANKEHRYCIDRPSWCPLLQISNEYYGQWIRHDTGHSIYYDCSLCGCVAPCTETADKILWKMANYCPDCGAKMENNGERWRLERKMTFEEIKEMFKKSIDTTDNMNQAIENFIQSIYLKGYNDALNKAEVKPQESEE